MGHLRCYDGNQIRKILTGSFSIPTKMSVDGKGKEDPVDKSDPDRRVWL